MSLSVVPKLEHISESTGGMLKQISGPIPKSLIQSVRLHQTICISDKIPGNVFATGPDTTV